jgi:FKBP-type peptidyl-prolyl cis-trans isomerase
MNISKNIMVVAGITALVAISYFGLGAANKEGVVQAEEKVELKGQASGDLNLDSEKAKLGYTIGASIGQDIARGGMIEEIDLDAFLAAIKDSATGAKPRLTPEQMQQAQQAFQLKRQQAAEVLAKENEAKGAQNKVQGDAFLATNKVADGTITTDSGLQYQVVREGKGKQPTATDKVKVHYLGTLIDSTKFDSSYDRDQPADFPVSGVIPGFSEGLQLMKEGAKYRFVIPAELAYGLQAPPAIGPNQALIFEVELLQVL